MYLPSIYEKYNRVRGNGEKTKGLAVLVGSFLLYMGVSIFLNGNLVQAGCIVLAITLQVLLCFKWMWGSKYWATGFDSRGEEGFELAEHYADKRAARGSELWKSHALYYMCKFKFTVGYTLIGIACLNPLIPLVGLFGGKIAKIYDDAFIPHDSTSIERAELESGRYAGNLALYATICNSLWVCFLWSFVLW